MRCQARSGTCAAADVSALWLTTGPRKPSVSDATVAAAGDDTSLDVMLAAPGCDAGRGEGDGAATRDELAGYRRSDSLSGISSSGATWPGVLLPALQGSSLIPAIWRRCGSAHCKDPYAQENVCCVAKRTANDAAVGPYGSAASTLLARLELQSADSREIRTCERTLRSGTGCSLLLLVHVMDHMDTADSRMGPGHAAVGASATEGGAENSSAAQASAAGDWAPDAEIGPAVSSAEPPRPSDVRNCCQGEDITPPPPPLPVRQLQSMLTFTDAGTPAALTHTC